MLGVSQRDVNQTFHNNKQALKDCITEVLKDIPKDNLVKACSCIQSWLVKVVEANGNFFR